MLRIGEDDKVKNTSPIFNLLVNIEKGFFTNKNDCLYILFHNILSIKLLRIIIINILRERYVDEEGFTIIEEELLDGII